MCLLVQLFNQLHQAMCLLVLLFNQLHQAMCLLVRLFNQLHQAMCVLVQLFNQFHQAMCLLVQLFNQLHQAMCLLVQLFNQLRQAYSFNDLWRNSEADKLTLIFSYSWEMAWLMHWFIEMYFMVRRKSSAYARKIKYSRRTIRATLGLDRVGTRAVFNLMSSLAVCCRGNGTQFVSYIYWGDGGSYATYL